MPPLFNHPRVTMHWWLLSLLAGLIVAGAAAVVVRSLIVGQALNQSRAVADMAEHIGTWASRYGGIHVRLPGDADPARAGTFLERHLYRVDDGAAVEVKSGAAPTAQALKHMDAYYSKNPALIQREVADISAESPTGNRFRLTARSVFNPANAPDAFELRALDAMRGGRKEYVEAGSTEMRYARSVIPDNSCLACHGRKADAPKFMQDNRMFSDGGFGYVAGQPDAIISVSVHMQTAGEALARSLSSSAWAALLALLAALAGVAALGARGVVVSRMQARQVAVRAVEHMRVRQAERERIAADLHDTLLQGIYGLLLRMQTLSQRLPDSQTRAMLEGAIVRAENLASEGRDRVAGLRTSPAEAGDIAEQLRGAAADLERAQGAVVAVQVSGAPHALAPDVQEQLHLIGREAMSNAALHAAASRIEVELEYGGKQLRLTVRDDGRGILRAGGVEGGHWGLTVMQERARRVGGQLEIGNAPDGGTVVQARIPAEAAYLS
jgi:signal transduction histidine kinase